ncbi:MAG TPA: MaoC family dehydratase N-terminal domain-containing protein [Pseudonocardiaceae bacterium]
MRIEGAKGHRFPPREFLPEEVLCVAQYARVIGSTDPAYFSTAAARDAGFAARPLPHAIFSFFQAVPERELYDTLDLTFGKTLFAGAETETGVVATETDTVVGRTWVEDVYEKPGRDGGTRQFLILMTEFTVKETSDMIMRSRLTFIEKH